MKRKGRQISVPSKNDALRRLRLSGFKFGSVLDVGVMTSTPELIRHYGDLPQLLCEPVEEFHDELRRNYRDAGIDFILEPRAVGSSKDAALLEVIRRPGGTGITHAGLVKSDSDAEHTRPISSVSLDASVAEHKMQSPYLLKVDVDGGEIDVLLGAAETLKDTLAVIVEATFNGFSEIDRYLSSCGFEIYDVVDICYYEGKFWQCDFVFYNPILAERVGVERRNSLSDLSEYQPFIPEKHLDVQSSEDTPRALNTPNMTELENYRLLVPRAVQKLARSGPLDNLDWKGVARKQPANVTVWNAIRRAHRRLSKGQQLGFFDEPPFARQDVRVCQLIKRLSIPIHTVLDVGASNGQWTEHVKTVFPDAEFHLFEPLVNSIPDYRDEHARRKAAGEKYTLHEMALSDSDGEAVIEVHDNVYASSLLELGSTQGFSKIKVSLGMLDTLLSNGKVPQADIIKMDTQGSELKILRGATHMLKDTKFIVVESWFQRGYGPETPLLSEIVAFMTEHGFQPFDYGDPWRQDWDGRLGALDIWFANTSIAALRMKD